jgi:hypothetical protein
VLIELEVMHDGTDDGEVVACCGESEGLAEDVRPVPDGFFVGGEGSGDGTKVSYCGCGCDLGAPV